MRLRGVELPEASEVLASLDWPRPSEHAYMRVFVVLVHQQATSEAGEPSGSAAVVGSTA